MIEDRYFSARLSILFAIYFHALSLFFSRSVPLCLCVAVLLVCFFRLPVSSLFLARLSSLTSFYLLSSPPLVSTLQLSFSLTIFPLFLFAFCQLSLRTTLLLSLSILLFIATVFFYSSFVIFFYLIFFLDYSCSLFSSASLCQFFYIPSLSFFLFPFCFYLLKNFFLSSVIFYNYFSGTSCSFLVIHRFLF